MLKKGGDVPLAEGYDGEWALVNASHATAAEHPFFDLWTPTSNSTQGPRPPQKMFGAFRITNPLSGGLLW